VKPSCSHFWLCAANGFVELPLGKRPDSITADAAAVAMTMIRRTGTADCLPTEQIADASVNCYSSQPCCVEPFPATHRRTAIAPCPTTAARRRGHHRSGGNLGIRPARKPLMPIGAAWAMSYFGNDGRLNGRLGSRRSIIAGYLRHGRAAALRERGEAGAATFSERP
jgi:hypothetical protein